ncbi:MAG TPA: DUF512 domain-containing protein, partial [Ktedonobacterales bacterium]|nr:DUF512 domain-containing protein [Ktedonobacterales bacterium]
RHLLDAWARTRRDLPDALPTPRRLAIITGTMAEPVMRRIAADLRRVAGLEVRLLVVENRFFGATTTVAGLLCGQDVLDALAARAGDLTPDDLVLAPRVLLDNGGTRFLDDLTVADFRARVTPQVEFAKTAGDLLAAVAWLAAERPAAALA